jgi:hypothetical protein
MEIQCTWYVCKGVIITKHNFANLNYHLSSKCCFLIITNMTIKHLLYQCKFTHAIWSVKQPESNVYALRSVTKDNWQLVTRHWSQDKNPHLGGTINRDLAAMHIETTMFERKKKKHLL